MIDQLIDEYGTGKEKGASKFKKIIEKIKHDGRKKKYDCVIGVSGGTDSMLWKCFIKLKSGVKTISCPLR